MARVTTSDTAVDARQRERREARERREGGCDGEDGQNRPSLWQARLRRFGHVARPRPGVRRRLDPPFPQPDTRLATLFGLSPQAALRLSRWAAWGVPVLIALVAGVLRFWQLGSPHAVIFDETYYAKDAWSLLHHGYEGTWPDNANDKILGDPQSIPLSPEGSYVVHPPVGKWIIALGEGLFGLTPFGWRFMTAVLGTLSVLMLCRIGRRLLRSTALGCLAGALMAVDGLHFVMSRTALLDLVLMFWVLAAFGCLLVDRDRSRARLANALPPLDPDSKHPARELKPDASVADRMNFGWRPWRLLAGVCLGLGFATKWNGLYILAAFGILTVLWDVGARRTAGAARPFRSMLRRDALPAFISLPVVTIATYVASWSGWFATSGGYFRDWATKAGAAGPWGWLPGPLRSLWHYEYEVYEFHVNLTSGHTYQSNPWSWLVLGRPVSYFYESPKAGKDGCTDKAEGCAREVLALGTPMLWWAACLALLYILYRWFFRRDWRAGAILCGVAAGYLPWFAYQERTIFLFYAVVFVPFLCLALAMAAGALAGPPGVSDRRRAVGVVAVGVVGLLIVWNFIYFWPIYTGQTIPVDAWRQRMWFDTWI
ncbi:dolichyl-phosphate-mannose--protein mannosyltransferase [Streptomyces iconiensis]|uniref:Polyprenol-phosphate-mannose--protein mannosyltransferase n=1 Tax=Streptomyces iconiensis TaxID=1384038 RepID=A0ABT7A6Y3_9ACTN|nr:phospholipid carrier-dependent glycosyltransferase [Streptomyces iconiensis]MDJ1136393.1 phospholipid carrier-dependent glycosyltransferase [Streptomyces iconiensis]